MSRDPVVLFDDNKKVWSFARLLDTTSPSSEGTRHAADVHRCTPKRESAAQSPAMLPDVVQP
eukprot:4197522-Prymnesium_polylepis.1